MERNTENLQASQKLKSSQINMALGLFLLIFAIIIFISIFFTETFIGKMTNLGAGVILLIIGGGMFWKAKLVKKHPNN